MIAGGTPIPLTGTETGLPVGPLKLTESVAERRPMAPAVKVRWIAQVAPAPRTSAAVQSLGLDTMAKSVGFVPAIEMVPTVTGAGELLKKFTTIGGSLVTISSCPPKSMLPGSRKIPKSPGPTFGAPVPCNVSVIGLPGAPV